MRYLEVINDQNGFFFKRKKLNEYREPRAENLLCLLPINVTLCYIDGDAHVSVELRSTLFFGRVELHVLLYKQSYASYKLQINPLLESELFWSLYLSLSFLSFSLSLIL